MSRFREFAIQVFGDGEPRARAAQARIAPFTHALDWAVRSRRPEAPFAKLAVVLLDRRGDSEPVSGHKDGSIAVCYVPADHARLATLSVRACRREAAALTIRAIEWTEATFKWRDNWFRSAVHDAGAHAGPYRHEWVQLRARDRTSGRQYVPVLQFDEAGITVLVSRHEKDGAITGERPLGLPLAQSLYRLLDQGRKGRIIEDRVVYFDRTGAPIARLDLSTFDSVGE